MKRFATLLVALTLTAGCALQGGTIGPPTPPVRVPVYTFGVVACGNPSQPCSLPIEGADIAVNSTAGYVHKKANGDGFALFTSIIPFSDIVIHAEGYLEGSANIQPPTLDQQNLIIALQPKIAPLPPPPTREDILNVHLTFQGLTVQTQQYGRLPWFEAALPWLTPQDRAAVYAAKHASTAWGPGGDTHIIISLPSGPPLYDEPGQPYSADRFGPLDWTNPADGRLADLVAEAARAGFNKQLLFLGGDDGQAGFPIAMAQLDTVHVLLRGSRYGDLGGYVVVLPGWDGVFYGYTPEQVTEWGTKCRTLFLYCGIEHQPGRIPVGEGGRDYLVGGRMRWVDLLLAEFNGPNNSAWRATATSRDAQGHADYPGNQIWQIGARMLGYSYVKPSDQPADADAYTGAGYLAPGSDRGPYVHCAFEWTGEYFFVRDQQTSADQQRSRDYFKSAGWTCGG